jgi:hypothetical protein
MEIAVSSKNSVSARTIIENFETSGRNPLVDGKINYLPLNDNEMYNWSAEKITFENFTVFEKIKLSFSDVRDVSSSSSTASTGGSLASKSSGAPSKFKSPADTA